MLIGFASSRATDAPPVRPLQDLDGVIVPAVLRKQRDPLSWIRRRCSALPGSVEVRAWGHPNFQVAGRTFAVFEIYKRRPCIAISADPEEQSILVDRFGFFKTPYIGSRGWVSAWVDQPAPFGLMRDLIAKAHRRLVQAPRRTRASRRSQRRVAPRPSPNPSRQSRRGAA